MKRRVRLDRERLVALLCEQEYAAHGRECEERGCDPDPLPGEGYGRCAQCKSYKTIDRLEIDHVDGRDWDPARVSGRTRINRYWDEYARGVRLRSLCRKCNGTAWIRRPHATSFTALINKNETCLGTCGAVPVNGGAPCIRAAFHLGLHNGGKEVFRTITWGTSARSKLYIDSAKPRTKIAPGLKASVAKIADIPAPAIEEWKFFPGSCWYEVSNLGRVRSWKGWRGRRLEQPKLLRLCPCGRGKYSVVGIRGFPRNVGRLVALAFIGPKPPGMVLRHLNDNGFDNALNNLVYGTQLDNVRDSIRNATIARGARRGRSRLSTRVLAKRFGVGSKTIWAVKSRTLWKHVIEAPDAR